MSGNSQKQRYIFELFISFIYLCNLKIFNMLQKTPNERAADCEDERLLLQLAEEGDQEIIENNEKADFEQYLQSLVR